MKKFGIKVTGLRIWDNFETILNYQAATRTELSRLYLCSLEYCPKHKLLSDENTVGLFFWIRVI